MKNYAILSLETHLFFSRIMKEHSLFLQAGFPCKNHIWIQKADWFQKQFENLLLETLRISTGNIHGSILYSNELVTEYTIPAEKRTQYLSGIPINHRISTMEKNLQAGCSLPENCTLDRTVFRINQRALHLLDGLISFKENILREVSCGGLFTTNYPLLIQHIIREARLYRNTIEKLQQNKCNSYESLYEMENFWNQIMMEHALFIRGLLDPSEADLIDKADGFAADYKKLLEMAQQQDCLANSNLTEMSLAETLKYREFKTAGAEGILENKIVSIILPLLADHVLREANHYIRILECVTHERGIKNGTV